MLEIKNRYIKYQEIFALKDREATIVLQDLIVQLTTNDKKNIPSTCEF